MEERAERTGPVTRRRALALGASGAAVMLAGGAGLLAPPSGGGTTRTDPSGAGTPAAGTFGAAGALDPAAAAAVLANRARAVRDGDRMAFLATVGDAPAEFQDAQSRMYDNLRALPLEGWRERVAGTQAMNTGAMNTGAMDDEHAIVRVEVRYRLRGFDRGEVARTRYLALAPRGGTWTIAGDGTSRGLTDDADIWDAGPLAVARGRAALVIGDAAGLRGIAARLDAAVPDVTGVVGAGWARRVVALAPADPGLASALAGPGQSLGQIAALATVAPAPSSGGRGEDRIVVSPTAFGRLNDLGRTVVLTHELTHVATGGARDRRTPLWLIEGFADYVGYRHVEIGARAAAGELRREVAAGRVPAALPGTAAFAGGSPRLSQAYQEAWLACRMVAGRYGEATLVRLYRAAGHASEAAALRDVLGLTRERFTGMWRDYVKKELT
ncbi:basic secretory family protein [Actinomadura madurae]|uniref:basic secretory family protein n=3 Tax=Actinomadura madurae TaxID=1993 RepID=UPI002025F4C2|nr:basic secretory family protein [Actinomadura madurae]URN00293.1 basic secretory family protein [Actinomadura madurae]